MLQKDKYSEFSDVWAFGVVIWEIYSEGTTPYYQLSNAQVTDFVCVQKKTLSPPDRCPQVAVDVMNSCFIERPSSRLKFQDILSKLEDASLPSPVQLAATSSPSSSTEISTETPQTSPKLVASPSSHYGYGSSSISETNSSQPSTNSSSSEFTFAKKTYQLSETVLSTLMYSIFMVFKKIIDQNMNNSQKKRID